MNSSKTLHTYSFLKGEKGKTSTPECSHTHNQTNIHYLNTDKTNNTIKKGKGCFYPKRINRKWMKKQPKPHRLMSCFSNYIKITVSPQNWTKNIPLPKERNVKKIMSNINHNVHRVCTLHNTPPQFDQNRSKNSENNSTTLLSLIKHNNYVYYSILTINNMFTGLSRFIIHLFISITNLLYIYSLLFIFLLVYIFYYLSLFLEEKNNQLRKLENQLSNYKNQLFIKNNRRH